MKGLKKHLVLSEQQKGSSVILLCRKERPEKVILSSAPDRSVALGLGHSLLMLLLRLSLCPGFLSHCRDDAKVEVSLCTLHYIFHAIVLIASASAAPPAVCTARALHSTFNNFLVVLQCFL